MHASPRTPVPPPDFLQLAGHPLRWRLLVELAQSDRAVQELAGRLGETQNLVSYHLGKLRDGRLVRARRSAADRRDTYYTADLSRIGALLSASGAALHPGLRRDAFAPAGSTHEATKPTRVSVLFLCTGNSARSQMAEALVRARSRGTIDAHSAGSHPRALHPNAIRVMRDQHGLDLSGACPKHLDVYANERFDWVISLCDRVREVCPEFMGQPETVHWSIPNPATEGPDDATYPRFRETAAELSVRIAFLLAAIDDRGPSTRDTQEVP
jgi:protein-tyrosine-phosphatase/DNA-binding transcriptional ArsR family regulator